MLGVGRASAGIEFKKKPLNRTDGTCPEHLSKTR